MDNTCFACQGTYHPSSGNVFFYNNQPLAHYCGPCYRHFLKFVKSQMKRKCSKSDFYLEAANCHKFPNNPLEPQC